METLEDIENFFRQYPLQFNGLITIVTFNRGYAVRIFALLLMNGKIDILSMRRESSILNKLRED